MSWWTCHQQCRTRDSSHIQSDGPSLWLKIRVQEKTASNNHLTISTRTKCQPVLPHVVCRVERCRRRALMAWYSRNGAVQMNSVFCSNPVSRGRIPECVAVWKLCLVGTKMMMTTLEAVLVHLCVFFHSTGSNLMEQLSLDELALVQLRLWPVADICSDLHRVNLWTTARWSTAQSVKRQGAMGGPTAVTVASCTAAKYEELPDELALVQLRLWSVADICSDLHRMNLWTTARWSTAQSVKRQGAMGGSTAVTVASCTAAKYEELPTWCFFFLD